MMAALANQMGVATQPAIARAEVKKTVRPADQSAAVVIPIWLLDFQQHTLAGEIGFVRIGFGNLHFAEHVALWAVLRVVNVESPVRLELWVERECQQPFLVLHERLPI